MEISYTSMELKSIKVQGLAGKAKIRVNAYGVL
jgi:hypothetical protein